MRSQMRLAAALWSLNFLTGCTPGRLLQIATSRFAGQDLASSANSGWLLKLSNGVVVAAAASSGMACAVMLLWVSIVKVVIVICPLFRALRGHDMDHSARLETQGNSEQYRRWRTCGDGRRPEPRMIQNSLAFRPQERDACHDRAARVIKENLTMTPSPADGQNCLPTLSLMLPDTPRRWPACTVQPRRPACCGTAKSCMPAWATHPTVSAVTARPATPARIAWPRAWSTERPTSAPPRRPATQTPASATTAGIAAPAATWMIPSLRW